MQQAKTIVATVPYVGTFNLKPTEDADTFGVFGGAAYLGTFRVGVPHENLQPIVQEALNEAIRKYRER